VRGGRPDVWVTLYSSFFSGVARTWTLVDAGLLCYNRYALSSPLCPPFHRASLSLMNFIMFFHLVQHHTIIIITHLPCTPTHISPLLLFHVLSLLLSSLLRRPLLRLAWEQYSLYNLSASPHTFFRNFSRIHISSSPCCRLTSIINNKQKSTRSLTAAPRPRRGGHGS